MVLGSADFQIPHNFSFRLKREVKSPGLMVADRCLEARWQELPKSLKLAGGEVTKEDF